MEEENVKKNIPTTFFFLRGGGVNIHAAWFIEHENLWTAPNLKSDCASSMHLTFLMVVKTIECSLDIKVKKTEIAVSFF